MEYRGPGTDTQNNFTRAEYEAAGGTDLADYNPGSQQWNWAEQQLRDARRRGQIVMVQWHHSAFSSGEHGLPMYHEDTSGQGGTPMRKYHPLMEKYGVAAVLSGHSELFERSFVDRNGDGVGVQYYDVGIAGDALRGERRTEASLTAPYLATTRTGDGPPTVTSRSNGSSATGGGSSWPAESTTATSRSTSTAPVGEPR